MYVHFNGRTMKAQKAVEMWRKANQDKAEINLRKLVIRLLRWKTT